MRKNEQGFILEAVAVLVLFALVVGFFFALACIHVKLSNEVVSGIVYNTTFDAPISGNTNFSIRAGENTPVTQENKSTYCLPPNSQYLGLIKRAAEDKRIKVVVTANKYHFRMATPWTCIPNVTVSEVK